MLIVCNKTVNVILKTRWWHSSMFESW